MMRLLPLLALVALMVPQAVAQTSDEEFMTQVLQGYLESDEAAYRLILQDAKRSLRLFESLKQSYPKLTTGRERQRTLAFCNAVAQAFAEEGNRDPDSALRAAGMHAEGDGLTPQTPPPAPRAHPAARLRTMPEEDWDLFDYLEYYRHRCLTWGNRRASVEIFEISADFMATFLWEARGKKGRAVFRRARSVSDVLRISLLLDSREIAEAVALSERVLPRLHPNKQFLVRVNLAVAGDQVGEPHLTDENLARASELRSSGADADEIDDFILATLKFFRELDRDPGISTDQVLLARDQAFQYLENWTAGEESDCGRVLGIGIRKWGEMLQQRADEESEPGLRRKLNDRANAGYQVLYRASELAALGSPYRASYLLELTDIRIENSERAIRRGLLDEARWGRDVAFQGLRQLEEIAAEEGTGLHATALYLIQVVDDIQRGHEKAGSDFGLRLDFRPLDFNPLEGKVSSLRSRLEQLDALLESREAKMKPNAAQLSSIRAHLEKALAADALAEKGRGYAGLEDPNFMAMELLRELKAPGWEDEVLELSQATLTRCEQIQFRAGVIASLAARAEAQEAKKDLAGALASSQRAVGLIEQYLLEAGPRSSNAVKMRARFADTYALLTRLQLAGGNQQSAFDTLGRMQQASTLAPLPASDVQVARIENLRGRTNQLETQLESQRSSGQDSGETEQLLASTKSEFYTALTALRKTHPEYESRLAIRPVNYTRLQKFIPEDTVVLQYFPCANESFIFVATHKDLKIRKLPVTEQELASRVLASRRLTLARESADDVLRQLFVDLVAPAESDLAEKKVIAFVPTGALCYLPFGSLLNPKSSEYLIETHQCVTLLKSVDLDQLMHGPTSGSGETLALGNPDQTLPGAAREVVEIARLMPQAQAFVGADASRERLTQMSSPLAYLHLATHGVLNSSDQNASYLVVAGPEGPERLTVPQICELNLDGVRLVTLSACQTALGERNPGSELTTLADAFSVAGANAVIASLWKVQDESTEKLMSHFYAGLKAGKTISQSLQEAQIKMIRESGYAAPFYWAPFVLLGDWR